jgi:transcriptional regulator with XRE-family HTH domain
MTPRIQILERFADFVYRHAYIDSFVDSYLATQIKALREQRGLTQTSLAESAKMKQSQISRLEDVNNSSWTVSTLKRIAKALDLVLVIRFESFGKLLPDIETFGRSALERPSFKDDPVFAQPGVTEAAVYPQLEPQSEDVEYVQVQGLAAATRMEAQSTFSGNMRPHAA